MKVYITCLFFLTLTINNVFGSEGVTFSEESYEEVMQKAKAQGKKVLLDFTASWCIPCKKMDRETFSNQEVSDLLNKKFINLKVNVDYFWGMDIAEKYRVKGYPTILVITPSENIVKRIVGFKTAQELIQAVKYL